MSPSRIRIFSGACSALLLALIFFFINSAAVLKPFQPKHIELISILIFFSNLIIIFVWMGFGKIAGFAVSAASCAYAYFYIAAFENMLELCYMLPFVSSGFIGYKFANKYFKLTQANLIEAENINEEINLWADKLEKDKKELELLEKRLQRFSRLCSITEKLSSSLSEEDVIRTISENAYSIIGKADRILFFLVDTKKQSLELKFSKRISETETPYIKLKNGDIFDRWVLRKKQPLLVEDISNDFRFSLEGEKIDECFNSIISVPLSAEEKVLGILRLDSARRSFYTQEDLRLLDIISDLGSVALENAVLYKQLSGLAITDGLTLLFVHKYFKERLANEIKRSLKNKTPFSLLLMDIDNFKDYNDKHGHTAGDLVLKHMAEIIKMSLSGGDFAARYGGEEFALILLGKDKKEAVLYAENLCKKIKNTPIVLRRVKANLTVSIGVASCPEDSSLIEDILRYADNRLYKAKEKGKNRVWAE